jgi:hypothetical protein
LRLPEPAVLTGIRAALAAGAVSADAAAIEAGGGLRDPGVLFAETPPGDRRR